MSDKVTNPATQYTGPGTMVQGPPEQGEGAEIYRLVVRDMVERAEFGAQKYGHALRTTAGVDFLINAYQEALDLCVYLRGEIVRRELAAQDAVDTTSPAG